MRKIRDFSVVVLVLSSLTGGGNVNAASSVSLELGGDNNSGQNYYSSGRFDLDVMVLKVSAGESSSDVNGFQQTSDTSSIGLQTNPSKLFNISIDASRSNQITTVHTDSTSITLELNTDNWNVFLSPDKRDINVDVQRLNQSVSLQSEGVFAGVSYYAWDPVYVSYSRVSNDYDRDLSGIVNRELLFSTLFGSATFDQIFSFEDKRSTFELGYYFTQATLAFNYSTGRSAVDGSIATSYKAALDYSLDKSWAMGFILGASALDISNESTVFSSVRLSYRW